MTAEFVLNKYMDVKLSDSKIEAFITMHTEPPESSVTVEGIEALLRDYKVTYGLQMDTIKHMALFPRVYLNSNVVVARGVEPVAGMDGSIEYSSKLKDHNRKPVENEDGTVNYKEVTQLNNVSKGQLIASRTLATEGTAGYTVTNEVIAPKAGKDARFKAGKNVVVDPSGGGLYAAISGLIAMTEGDKINVFPVYEVNGDVDYNIGNIDFVGTVVVRGNVLTGFRIKASGDIRIVGGVEGAELFADGSIEITGGIIGGHKGIVRAKSNVKCSFVQEGNVEAGVDVLISQSIMHSHVRAGRNVICEGVKGLIVGGIVQAGECVNARTIGNTASTATTIEVGVLPELRNELIELRHNLNTINDNLEKTNKALLLLDQVAAVGQLTPERQAMRVKLHATKQQANQEQYDTRGRILEIEKVLDNTDIARVNVNRVIYNGCKIVVGRYTRFIKDSTSRVTFKFSEGEIKMIPLV